MNIPQFLSLALSILVWTSSVSATLDCTTTYPGMQADIVFMIDVSSSMCVYTDKLSQALSRFVSGITAAKVDVKYAVVMIAGNPAIAQPFTSDAAMTQNTLNSIGCGGTGWEPSLEAIRVLLAPNYGADFAKSCNLYGTGSPCNIIWRATAKKSIILVTDEDSDMPYKPAYRVGSQNYATALCPVDSPWDGTKKAYICQANQIEPNWSPKILYPESDLSKANWFRTDMPIKLDQDYVDEIKLTASMLLSNKVFVNMVVNTKVSRGWGVPKSWYNVQNRWWWDNYAAAPGSPTDTLSTMMAQFGHPDAQVESDTTPEGFDDAKTLQNLRTMKVQDSLQARILEAGGLSRVFDLQKLISNDTDDMGRLYSEKIYDVLVQQLAVCQQVNYSSGSLPSPTVTGAAKPPPTVTDYATSYISSWANQKITTTTTTTTKTTTTTSTTTKTKTTTSTSTTSTPTTTTTTTTTTSTSTTYTTTTTTTPTTTTTSGSTTTTTSTPTTSTTSTTSSTTTTTTTSTNSTTTTQSTTSTTSTTTTTTTPTTTSTSTTTTSSTTSSTSTTTSTTSTTTSTTTTTTSTMTSTSTTSTTSTSTTTTNTIASGTTLPPIPATTLSTTPDTATTSTTSSTTTSTTSTSSTFTSSTTSTTSITTTDTTTTSTTTTTRTTTTSSTSTTTTTTTDTTTTTTTTDTTTTTTTTDTTTTTTDTTTTTTTTDTTTTTTDTTTTTTDTTTTTTTTTDTTTTTSTTTTTTDTTTTTTDTTTSTTTSSTTTTDTTTTTTDNTTTTTTDTTTTSTSTTTRTTTVTATPSGISYNGFCGDGRIGNGTCEEAYYCCTGDGWCDQGYDACGFVVEDPDQTVDDPEETLAPDEGYCTDGFRGSGQCEDDLLECSVWGWCVPRKNVPTATAVPIYDTTETPTPTATPEPEEATQSTAVIAGGVGVVAVTCGAAAALFVYRLSKKRKAAMLMSSALPTTNDAFISINPLYEATTNTVTNPLYEQVTKSTDALL